MPFTNSDIDFDFLTFIRNPANTSQWQIADDVDWLVTYGIDPANVTVTGVAIRPDTFNVGFSYVGGGSSALNNFPLASDGTHQKGRWRFQFTVVVAGAVDPGTYTLEDDIENYCPETLTPQFSWQVNCNELAPIVTAQDGTAYATGMVITSRVLTLYSIEPAVTYTNSLTGVSVNSGNDRALQGDWRVTMATEGTVGSFTTDGKTVTTTYIVTEKAGGKAVGTSSYLVSCKSACELNCLLRKAYARWQAASCTDFGSPEYLTWGKAVWEYQSALVELNNCGSSAEYQKHVDSLYLLTNSSEGCDCGSEADSDYITPNTNISAILSIQGINYVDVQTTSGNSIVNLTTVGNDILTNSRLDNLSSPNSTISVASSTNTATTPDTTNWELDVEDTQQARDSVEMMLTLDMSSGFPVGSVTLGNVKGVLFQNPTMTITGSVLSDIARIQVSDFEASTLPNDWKPEVQIVSRVVNPTLVASYAFQNRIPVEIPAPTWATVVVRDQVSKTFDFTFRIQTFYSGAPISYLDLQSHDHQLQIKIAISL